MQKSTLGLLAALVLFAGVLTHASGDVFAVSDKKSISSEEKKMEDQKIKNAEKTRKDTTTKTKEKSVGKTMKSTKHRKSTAKKDRLAAGIKH